MHESTKQLTDVKTNLRRPVDFVGRKNELREILKALDPHARAWIVSLTGVGGIGKTELAVQVGHLSLERRLFDNVIWATAKQSWLTPQGIRAGTPEYALNSLDDLLNTIIQVLQLDPRLYRVSEERKVVTVNEALSQARSLLIVDNLETVHDRSIIRFLEELPQPSKALITTRIGGITVDDLVVAGTLQGQREVRVGPLSEEDAIELFTKRAKDQGLIYSRSENADVLQEVVARAAYIPLAIEWIIGQVAINHYSLKDTLDSLQAPQGEVLRYCFDTLISSVGRQAFKVLIAIPVFVESVSYETLAAVVGMQKDRLSNALHKLAMASLIEIDPDSRYRVLEPTRLYVRSLWRQFPDLYQEYSVKATEYYCQFLRVLDQQQGWAPAEYEHRNMVYLLRWCFDNNRYDAVVSLAQSMMSYLDRLGYWDQRAAVCEMGAISALNLGKHDQAVDFAYHGAVIHKQRGRLDKALEEFERCEEYSVKNGDMYRAAVSRMHTGSVFYHRS